jgi:superfamily I DNA/RNA helicase
MTSNTPTIQWKETSTAENPLDSSLDPFQIPGDNRKTPLALPTPELSLSKKETNRIHKEFLEEIERKCLSLHNQLQFFAQDKLLPEDIAQYSCQEIETILRERSQLNTEQTEAALKCHKDLYIKALAGTGKTSLLSACISRLLALGTDPQTIAISSHTVTAAEEIKSRILPTLERLFPKTRETLGQLKPATGTIHALAYRELNFHKHPKARWTILDETQQFRIWMEAYQFAFPDSPTLKDENAWEDMRLFDRVRSYDIPEKMVPRVLELITQEDRIKTIAETYTQIKEARRLLDYTDLLREWAPLLIHPGYRGKWEYFFVDEFQDTNPLQKFLLKLLKSAGTTLVVCGDTRQSINSFTGSDPTSHTQFFQEVGIQETLLQTNYRCSQEILGLANEILKSMSPPEAGRLLPQPQAERGAAVELIFTRPARDNRKFLPPKEQQAQKTRENQVSCTEAIKMLEQLQLEKTDRASVAILYRTNTQGGELEETFAKINTLRQNQGKEPVKYIRKDFRRTALRNKTERELLSVLAAWAQPEYANWEMMLLSPYFHGIGEVTARNIHRKAERQKPKNRLDAESLFEKELSKRNAETIDEFFQAWESCEAPEQTDGPQQPPAEAACRALQKWILKTASRKTYEEGSKKEVEEAQRRSYEASLLEKILSKAPRLPLLSEILQEIQEENEKSAQMQSQANRALGLGESQTQSEKEEGIILSTIHLAKGREYDGVVLHQASYGSLPHFNALKFYKNEKNMREKGFRKYSTFPSLQGDSIDWTNANQTLPKIWRTETPATAPQNAIEEWEDHNNPIEEEKRLLYVAVTRAKKRLVITSRDQNYPYIHSKIWEKLKSRRRFTKEP